MSHPKLAVVLMMGLVLAGFGCVAPESDTKSVTPQTTTSPVVGGVAVGISPKVIQAEKGENISFNVDLLSSENADDRVTVNIKGAWLNKTFLQDIEAGENLSLSIQVTVPSTADNMTFTVTATSHNLGAVSSTTGLILISNGGKR
jgi:hypothetical protein